METVGNPSSVHAEGRAARRIVEDARNEVARLAGVSARCVTFTSGGTEAANAALNPLFGGGPGAKPLERLIVSAGEHPCVLTGHRFPTAEVGAVAAGRTRRSRLARGRVPAPWARAHGPAGGEQRDGRRSSRSPKRRRWFTPRAVFSSATRCRWPGGWLATSPRSAPTRSCCRPTRWAASRAQARLSWRAPGQPRRAAHSRRRAGARRARGHRIRRDDRGFRRGGAGVASPRSRRSRRGSPRSAIA